MSSRASLTRFRHLGMVAAVAMALAGVTIPAASAEASVAPAPIRAAASLATLVSSVPTISGTVAVGSKLTALTGDWSPQPVTFTYVWMADGAAISKATASTFTVPLSDVYKILSVKVTGSKKGYDTAVETSNQTSPVPVPVLSVPNPTISGDVAVGSKLTAVPGAWGPAPVTFSFQWFADGVRVSKATAPILTVPLADVGKTFSVTVTGTKTNYPKASATSDDTIAVPTPVLFAPTPAISGNVSVGSTLTAVPGSWGPTPVTLSYQWSVGATAVKKSTATTFTVPLADVGKTISVAVSGTKTNYAGVTKTSELTAVVPVPVLSAPTPTISGDLSVGSTLTATPGTWGPAPVALSYQWLANGVKISRATGSTFTVLPTDVGGTISVMVTGAKSNYPSLTSTSVDSAPVPIAVLVSPTPTISGSAHVGAKLTVAAGTWGPAPVTLKYQWMLDGVAISNARTTTYTVLAGNAGHVITVEVTGSKVSYPTVSAVSGPLPILGALSPTPSPTISGTAQVGDTLTATPGIWGPVPVILSYQWSVAGVAVVGATSTTFTPRPGDAGNTATVKVTGSLTNYATVSETSAPTGAIRSNYLAIYHTSGTISSDTIWEPSDVGVYMVDDQVTVASGVTLTIAAGTIVKGAGIVVAEGGHVMVQGTSDNPVNFTSVADDSIGGDSNGDGATGVTDADIHGAVFTESPGSSVTVSYAHFDYSGGLLDAPAMEDGDAAATFTMTDSITRVPLTVSNLVTLVAKRNVFNMRAYNGYYNQPLYLESADISGVVFTGADRNTFEGSDTARVVVLDESIVAAGTSATLSSEGGAVFVNQPDRYGLGLEVSGSLTLEPGTILKGPSIIVDDGAVFDANGTAESPIFFTSIADDSVGGDSEGDGAATGDALWAQAPVFTGSPTSNISVSHAVFTYAPNLFFDEFDQGNVSITDSVLHEPLSLYVDYDATATVQRDTFDPWTVPTSLLQDGRVDPALTIAGGDISGVAFSGPDANQFIGGAPQRLVSFGGTIPAGTTEQLSSADGALFELYHVDVAGTLDFAPGTVSKGARIVDGGGASITVEDGGTFDAVGTEAEPITFTSVADDSVGGVTYGDGTLTTLYRDDWSGGLAFADADGATVDISHAAFDYMADVSFGNINGTDGAGTVRVVDSVSRVPFTFENAGPEQGSYDIERNTFNLRPMLNPDGTTAGPFCVMQIGGMFPGIDFSGANANVFIGADAARLIYVIDASVPQGDSVTLSGEDGAVFEIADLVVSGDVTVTAGTVLKTTYGDDPYYSFRVSPTGSVDLAGTAAEPITVTSDADSSVGGDDVSGDPQGWAQWSDTYSVFDLAPSAQVSIVHANVDYQKYGLFSYDSAWGDNWPNPGSIVLTDSTLRVPVSLEGAYDFTVERNTFDMRAHPTDPDSPEYFDGLAPYPLMADQIDLTNVSFAGADRNTFVGSNTARVVELYATTIPVGSDVTFSSDDGAVFNGYGNTVLGTLTIDPGTVFKDGGITVVRGGTLNATGTADDPIVFTTIDDNTVAGDSLPGDDTGPTISGGAYLSYGDESRGTVTGTVFMNSTDAIEVDQWSLVTFESDVFTNNTRAIDVQAATDGSDPSIDFVWGQLPCAPPFTSQVTIDSTWFGATGQPGANFDLGDLAGYGFDKIEGDDTLDTAFGIMNSQFNSNVNISSNTVPWALYTCTVDNVGIAFPFTPVVGESSPYVPGDAPPTAYAQR